MEVKNKPSEILAQVKAYINLTTHSSRQNHPPDEITIYEIIGRNDNSGRYPKSLPITNCVVSGRFKDVIAYALNNQNFIREGCEIENEKGSENLGFIKKMSLPIITTIGPVKELDEL